MRLKSLFCLVCVFCFSLAALGTYVQVYCGTLICGDLVPDNAVNVLDREAASSQIGERMEIDNSCVEGPFTANGYQDANDELAWNWRLDEDNASTCCPFDVYNSFMDDLTGGASESFSPTAGTGYGSSLLITGNIKSTGGNCSLDDGLVIYDDEASYVGNPFSPVEDRSNGRLVCDSHGKIFQLNTKIGLVRLNDGTAVVTPGRFSITSDPRYSGSAIVSIGIQEYTSEIGTQFGGRAVMDAAIDGDDYVYVVPVVVIPSGDTSLTYLAAAKLQLESGQSPCYSIVRLYDDPPAPNDTSDPLRNGLSEIEVDGSGNVYITNAYYDISTYTSSNFLWVYPVSGGSPTKINLDTLSGVTGGIPAPTALFASKANSMLYLASTVNSAEATSVKIYGLTTENLALTLSRTVQINNMGHVTGMTEEPVSGKLWVTGFSMSDIPSVPDTSEPPFYHARLAQIPTTSNDPVQATSLDSSSSLAMPYSITWMPANLISATPADQHYLWRVYYNICRLTFDGDITLPSSGEIKIQQMLDNGLYGEDLSANFTITVENDSNGNPRILRIYETTQCLPNRVWIAVRNTGAWTGVAKFTVQYPIQRGDADDDGNVTQDDQDYVTTGILNFNCADGDRRDINGDRRILTTDHSFIHGYYPSTPVVKPSGH